MRLLGDGLVTGDADHWEMVAQKCRDCAKIAFPKKRVCPACFGEDLEDVALSKDGVIHAFTTTYLSSPEFEPPFVLALVDLPEGIKVMAQLDLDDPVNATLAVGQKVHAVLRRLKTDPDGVDVFSYKYQPVEAV